MFKQARKGCFFPRNVYEYITPFLSKGNRQGGTRLDQSFESGPPLLLCLGCPIKQREIPVVETQGLRRQRTEQHKNEQKPLPGSPQHGLQALRSSHPPLRPADRIRSPGDASTRSGLFSGTEPRPRSDLRDARSLSDAGAPFSALPARGLSEASSHSETFFFLNTPWKTAKPPRHSKTVNNRLDTRRQRRQPRHKTTMAAASTQDDNGGNRTKHVPTYSVRMRQDICLEEHSPQHSSKKAA